jgi:RNA polymerase sigma-70 factor (ECF subfamily)
MTVGRPKGGGAAESANARSVAVHSVNAHTVNAQRVPASDDHASDVPTDDLALVHRAQGGDRAAFKVLFERYHRRVYAVALAVLKVPQDAHDVVQEAFVKVHRHLPDFQGNSSFYTWLYRISMNLAIDQLRRRKSARQVDYDDTLGRAEQGDDPSNLTPVIDGADPGKSHSRKELATKLQAALATLPEYHQQVILLREVEGLSYEEIAKIMKVPKGTIMSRLFHARRKMQAALAEYMDGELTPQDDARADS